MAAALPEGYRRRAFDNVPSTNAEALTIARRGTPGGLWITANVQSAGRGRRGRVWSTEPGNLAASLILVDPSPVTLAPTLSFVAGVALHRAIVDVAGPAFSDRLALKWPNDLLLDGRKLAGILVEGENLQGGTFAVVVGVGSNCVSHPELIGPMSATDLAEAGASVTAEQLFEALAKRMAAEIAAWNRGAGFAETRAAWLQRAAGVGQKIRVNLGDREVEGRFDTLDETGRLVLIDRDGRPEALSAGDVFLAVGLTMAQNELVFLPLGGVGEIGMNLALYGYGPPHDRTWLAVDLGVAFAHADLPGVDLILPDVAYLEQERHNLAGIVITHAHEDHYGALLDLWPRLRVPVYATAFTAHLLAAKTASEPRAEQIPMTIVRAGDRVRIGPFEVEYIEVAHSIPESHALAIRTPLGMVVHSGDWKIDPNPAVGQRTDPVRFQALGDEGVLALMCDSTNAYREGHSHSEADVGRALTQIIAEAPGRIGFTTFASNVGRLLTIARAAQAVGRDVVVSGRAMRRVIDVATELGMMEGAPPFLDEEAFGYIPRDRVVVLLSGSQGEPRASLSRVANAEHPRLNLVPGDMVVFSSRAIPGNELAINAIVNRLVSRGITVITDEERSVHASGHPRRDELRQMYAWLRPQVAIPVHGEPLHLAAHAELARTAGVPKVLTVENGALVRLAPGPAETIDDVAAGRLYRDGSIIGAIDAIGVVERRRMSFAGHVAVSVILDDRGDVLGQPDIVMQGVPREDSSGRPLLETVRNAILGALDSIPRRARRDTEVVRDAVSRATRGSINEAWGKKPVCTVFVAVV